MLTRYCNSDLGATETLNSSYWQLIFHTVRNLFRKFFAANSELLYPRSTPFSWLVVVFFKRLSGFFLEKLENLRAPFVENMWLICPQIYSDYPIPFQSDLTKPMIKPCHNGEKCNNIDLLLYQVQWHQSLSLAKSQIGKVPHWVSKIYIMTVPKTWPFEVSDT